ncbi:MAG TPA: CmcI family methyltransferase [Chloroflexota bacterium]|nr:CmcI family methyltransferase [Chloroflexota bacterium]
MSGRSAASEPNAARELVGRVVAYLAERPTESPTIGTVASALGVSPKLLAALPTVRALLQPPGIEGFLDWTLRDWLAYHYLFVHQGYRYGLAELQPTWRGRIVLKNPLDCWVHQEIVHRTRPDVLVELGVAFGGSALFYADLFDLAGHGEVLAVDLTLERARDVSHPRLTLLEGSSIDAATVAAVRARCQGRRTMVVADSNHAESHVLAELRAYADLVGVGMYFVVEDTLADVLGLMPVPIGGPLPAVEEFLRERDDFVQDLRVAERYVLSQSPYGYLRRVR